MACHAATCTAWADMQGAAWGVAWHAWLGMGPPSRDMRGLPSACFCQPPALPPHSRRPAGREGPRRTLFRPCCTAVRACTPQCILHGPSFELGAAEALCRPPPPCPALHGHAKPQSIKRSTTTACTAHLLQPQVEGQPLAISCRREGGMRAHALEQICNHDAAGSPEQ